MQPWTSGLLPSSQHGSLWELTFQNCTFLLLNKKVPALAQAGSPVGEGPGSQRRCSTGRPAGRHEGKKAGRPACSPGAGGPAPRDAGVALGLPRKGCRLGAPGSRLPGKPPSSCNSRASESGLATLSRPSEEANKLLLQNNGAGEGAGAGGSSVHRAHRAAAPGKAVHLDVLGEVVAPRELLLTHRTLVGLHARVRAPVPRQLIGAGEPAGHAPRATVIRARPARCPPRRQVQGSTGPGRRGPTTSPAPESLLNPLGGG